MRKGASPMTNSTDPPKFRPRQFLRSLRCALPLLPFVGAVRFSADSRELSAAFRFHRAAEMRAELAGTALEGVIQTGKSTAMGASLQPSIIKMLNSRQVSTTALKEASAYLQNALIVQPYISSISICSHDRVVLRFPESSPMWSPKRTSLRWPRTPLPWNRIPGSVRIPAAAAGGY